MPDPKNEEDALHGPITVPQLMSSETPRIYLQSRLTRDMEAQLVFLLSNVPLGSQRRYQQWFQAKYLNSSESESLVPDLIRYICCVFVPPKEASQSNVIPRWAVIGWLIKVW